MYSQNNEEQYILNYFKGYKGTFLDIGAFDGKNLSNTYALAEIGWAGTCIEPSPEVFKLLEENHSEHEVKCYELAIGLKSGKQTLDNNLNGLATLIPSEKDRWGDTEKFEPIKVRVLTFKDFWQGESYDFINIDAEGLDYEIMTQIDFHKIGCKMLCVEWNSKEKEKYVDYMKGYKLIAENPENLIFTL